MTEIKNALYKQQVTGKVLVYAFTVKNADELLDDGFGGLDYGYVCDADGGNRSNIMPVGSFLAHMGFFDVVDGSENTEPVFHDQAYAEHVMAIHEDLNTNE